MAVIKIKTLHCVLVLIVLSLTHSHRLIYDNLYDVRPLKNVLLFSKEKLTVVDMVINQMIC